MWEAKFSLQRETEMVAGKCFLMLPSTKAIAVVHAATRFGYGGGTFTMPAKRRP